MTSAPLFVTSSSRSSTCVLDPSTATDDDDEDEDDEDEAVAVVVAVATAVEEVEGEWRRVALTASIKR